MSVLSQFFTQGSAAAGFIDIEMLMVAGGGGAGSGKYVPGSGTTYNGGSGGAGGVYYSTISVKPGSTCPITIGAGGAAGSPTGGSTYGNAGIRGGTTSITTPVGTYRVVGGGGGNTFADPVGTANRDGGSGGGGSLPTGAAGAAGRSIYSIGQFPSTSIANPSPFGPPGPPITITTFSETIVPYKNGSYYGHRGSVAPTSSFGGGSGGPGAVQPISNNFASDISGTITTYAAGGTPGGISGGAVNSGNGGSVSGSVGYVGGSGVLILRYPTQFAAASSFPGATDLSPSTPGFRTYSFTSSGSITLP